MRYMLFLLLLATLAMPVAAQEEIRFTLPADVTQIEVGQTLEAEISGAIQAHSFELKGNEGDAISAYLLTESEPSLYLYLLDPEGEMVVFERTSFINLDYEAYLPLYILPEDGTYTFVVTSSDNAIMGEAEAEATFTLTVETPTYTVIEAGETIIDSLDQVEGMDHMVDVYLLAAERTQIPYISLQAGPSTDLTVEPLLNPEPQALTPNRGADDIYYISPMYNREDDLYVLSVSSGVFSSAEEEYTLTVAEYEPYALEAGGTATLPLAVETLQNYASFAGTEGQEVTISMSAPEATNAALVLFDPAGRIAAVDDTGAGLENVELLEDGEYVIMVYPQSFGIIDAEQLGNVKVTLEVEE